MFFFRLPDLKEAKKRLPRYFAIREKDDRAKYLITKTIEINIERETLGSITVDDLWKYHEEGMSRLREVLSEDRSREVEGYRNGERTSLLDVKLELAGRIIAHCSLCEHRCGVDRNEAKGRCRVGKPHLSSEFLHTGEEPELVPSHTFFFSGCTFRCVFCQNWDISQNPLAGTPAVVKEVSGSIGVNSLRSANVNWVGGDPTPALRFILKVLAGININIPQIWNSNMYLTEGSMKLLDGVMDIYLTDLKYGNDACAKRLSKVDDYWSIITRNHVEANRQGEVIIRHLVMPGHVECCTEPILRFISEKMDTGRLRVNVMGQYRPEYKARKYEEIARRPSAEEMGRSLELAEKMGLSLCD